MKIINASLLNWGAAKRHASPVFTLDRRIIQKNKKINGQIGRAFANFYNGVVAVLQVSKQVHEKQRRLARYFPSRSY